MKARIVGKVKLPTPKKRVYKGLKVSLGDAFRKAWRVKHG